MGRWKKSKKLRTDDDGQQRIKKKGQGAGVGYQEKNVDKDGWIVTSTRHPQQRDPSNPVFEAFYKAQGVVPPGEWAAFMKTLLQPLPASFRINLDCDFAELYVLWHCVCGGSGPRACPMCLAHLFGPREL